jgi:hypothetical protein
MHKTLAAWLVLLLATAAGAQDKAWLNIDRPAEEAICFTLYTVHNGTMKMTAQLYPLADDVSRKVDLEIERDGRWVTMARVLVDDSSYGGPLEDFGRWTAHFRLRVVAAGGKATFDGVIRRDPIDKAPRSSSPRSAATPTRTTARGRHRPQPRAPGPGPALLRGRPVLRPQEAPRGVAALRPAVPRHHARPPHHHHPRRPRHRAGQPLGRGRDQGDDSNGGQRRVLLLARLRATPSRPPRPGTCPIPTTPRPFARASACTTPDLNVGESTSRSSRTASSRPARRVRLARDHERLAQAVVALQRPSRRHRPRSR